MRRVCPTFAALLLASACAAQVPVAGPGRIAWMREHLTGTVAKFEFTQGYDFRKDPERLRPFMEAIKARGFTAWDQHAAGGIWDDAAFESLERSVQAAAEVGLDVWATLSPPSGKQEIARMPLAERQEYYYTCAERFARLAAQHPNFVAFGCDDFLPYNRGFFTPEMMAEMARRWRSICPRLAFVPLVYWGSFDESFFATHGDYVDGIVFHFRAGSYPHAYIPGYDPTNFDMYGDVMRYELKRVRQMAGDHPVICGIYIWYYKGGWGVMTPDEQNPTVEHIVRDAVQKLQIAHDYADGVRVYGLGIDHEAYQAMQPLLKQWQAEVSVWGQLRGDPEEHLARWTLALGEGPYLGTFMQTERGLGYTLPRTCPWMRVELSRELERGEFDPQQAATRYPLLVASRAVMQRQWPDLLRRYAEAGGTLLLESVPGWQLDAGVQALEEGEKDAGEEAPTTRAMAELSGVVFHYEPRGFATRWRVVKRHPLTEGMGEVGVWYDVPFKEGDNTYGYLCYPVQATDAEVLIEVEHEKCPYDGVSYMRQGEITGVYPLLTVRQVGEGTVVRQYCHVSPQTVFGEHYDPLVANLLAMAGAQ
ncbi:MAG TPA: hypothetical protein VM283_01020 [Armatimonadota bacterium]|nr:hypothetical protein [Armatimonadota bacterium]